MDHSLLHALNALLFHHDDVEDPVVAYVNAAEMLFAGMLVLATVLAAGRVAMGVHYPSDVLGGALLDAGVALALHRPHVRRLVNRAADAAGGLLDRTGASLARPLRSG